MGRKKETTKHSRNTTHKRKKSGGGIAVFLVLTLMCLSVLFALSVTVLFKTERITVKGLTPYTNEQIIGASGIEIGKNMFVSIFTGAEENIETLLPYVKDAEIHRNFNGNVEITVKTATVSLNYAVENGYLLTDIDGKILENSSVPVADKPVIEGAELVDPAPGKEIIFSDSRAEQVLREVINAAEDNDLEVTCISTDATASFVDITVENRIIAKLGNGDNAAYRMLHLKESIAQLAEDESGIFTFSTDNDRKAYFEKCDIHAGENMEIDSDTESNTSQETLEDTQTDRKNGEESAE